MNRMLATFVVAVFAALSMTNSGCVIVSASSTSKNTTGAVWYVKRTVVGDDKVYYCPPDQDVACYKATIRK